MADSIIGLYKTEPIEQRGPLHSVDAAEYATLAWVHWFKHQRLLEPIGNAPPADFEAEYLRRSRELAIAA